MLSYHRELMPMTWTEQRRALNSFNVGVPSLVRYFVVATIKENLEMVLESK